jgi:hypothetical protein
MGKDGARTKSVGKLTFLPVPSLPGVGANNSPQVVDESKQDRSIMTSCCVCEAGTNGGLIHCETSNNLILFDDIIM